jgi:hypothetical protein
MQKRLVAHSVPQPAVAGGGGRAACVFGLPKLDALAVKSFGLKWLDRLH